MTDKFEIPTWTKALPLVGLVAGGYYAYHNKGNVGKMILYATIGAWALGTPAVYYAVQKVTSATTDSLTEKSSAK